MIRLRLRSGEQGCEGKKLKGFEGLVGLREKQFLRGSAFTSLIVQCSPNNAKCSILKTPQLSIGN